MKPFKFIHALLLSVTMFAMGGMTVRCNIEDDDDKDKDKKMEALTHMLTEHLGEASMKAGEQPDFYCQGVGIDDVDDDTDFDMVFIHGCNDI